MKKFLFRSAGIILIGGSRMLHAAPPQGQQSTDTTKFEISFSATAHAEPITGRIIVTLATDRNTFLFGFDVDQLQPGRTAALNARTLGYPLKTLKEVPAGDYSVQAVLNTYTRFSRADGHTIWAHMDQWEGQQYDRSPGNLRSEVQRIHLDPASSRKTKLVLTQVIPPVQVPLTRCGSSASNSRASS